jgi:hypothetical protein
MVGFATANRQRESSDKFTLRKGAKYLSYAQVTDFCGDALPLAATPGSMTRILPQHARFERLFQAPMSLCMWMLPCSLAGPPLIA